MSGNHIRIPPCSEFGEPFSKYRGSPYSQFGEPFSKYRGSGAHVPPPYSMGINDQISIGCCWVCPSRCTGGLEQALHHLVGEHRSAARADQQKLVAQLKESYNASAIPMPYNAIQTQCECNTHAYSNGNANANTNANASFNNWLCAPVGPEQLV